MSSNETRMYIKADTVLYLSLIHCWGYRINPEQS